MVDARFPALNKPSEGFLFLVTYGRSGSTLTQNLLNAIPGYCIRGENANALYHICRSVDVLSCDSNILQRQDQKSGRARPGPTLGLPIDPWYGVETMDTQAICKGLFDVFAREVLQIPDGTRVAGFKEIRYYHDLNFIPRQLEIMQSHFPRARLLFLTRDHDQVAKSGWWPKQDQEQMRRSLARADRAFHDYAANHRDCFVLDYAAYAEGPEALRPLYDFLGEEMQPDAVAEILGKRLTHGKPAMR